MDPEMKAANMRVRRPTVASAWGIPETRYERGVRQLTLHLGRDGFIDCPVILLDLTPSLLDRLEPESPRTLDTVSNGVFR